MNTNVINPSIKIQDGSLTIIGFSRHRGSVVLMATGLTIVGNVRFDQLSESVILTNGIGDPSDTVIFEYALRSELRNPHKLLKSVRSKLIHLMNLAHTEFDKWHAEYYRGSGME